MHAFQILVNRQVAIAAFVPHLEGDVRFAYSPFRRKHESLASQNAPVPCDLVVAANHVPDVQPAAGIDLHKGCLLGSNHTLFMTYVKRDV